jgi:methionine sulfoxide reductase heme-binding subunit
MKWIKKNWLWVIVNILAIIPLIDLMGLLEFNFRSSFLPEITAIFPEGLKENPRFSGKEISEWWFPIHVTGEWAIRWITFSLICTPLNILFKWKRVLGLRKITGLWAFVYSLLHVLFFIADQNIWVIFGEINYILGLISFLIMLPLALTSNKKSHQLMKKAWKKLHRWAYLAGVLAVVHVVVLEKGWELYAILISIGFVIRIPAVKSFFMGFREMKNKMIELAA